MRQQNLKTKRKIQKRKATLANMKLRAARTKAARERKAEEEAKERELAAERRAQKPRDWNGKQLGQSCANGGQALHVQARREFLDRMRVLFPLPADLEDIWPDFRERFPRYIGSVKSAGVGTFLLKASDEWQEAAAAAAGGKKGKTGKSWAPFSAFVRQWHAKMGPPQGSKRM